MNQKVKRVAYSYLTGACLALFTALTVASCSTKNDNVNPLLQVQSDSLKTADGDDTPPPKLPCGPGGCP
ncbi:hypothetical protein P1X15_23420 [Runella sp. MFBS21]|uniref:hypothetical protein n=1 Tax=Runella sp. MFBS21 TaxID=3034018 RepID=UPI0023F6DA9A|nr:hypothetical protein [Runella sp. MFBS21]MDF7820594.1 hypothetical protein [Runella sp. MFBS21]